MKKTKGKFSFSRGDYLEHLSRGALVVGFAGTAMEQAAFLGIPLSAALPRGCNPK